MLDGHNRYRACTDLQIEPKIEVKTFANRTQEKLFVIECAGNRRHLNNIQKVELAMKKEQVLKDIAEQNSLANLKRGNEKPTSSNSSSSSSLPLPSRSNERVGEVAAVVAKSLNLSPSTYKRGKYVLEKGSEEQKEKLRKGKGEIHREYNVIKKSERRKQFIDKLQRRLLISFQKGSG